MPRARSRASAPVEIASMLNVSALAHLHDGALAELLVDLGERHVEGLVAVSVHCGVSLSMGTNSMEPTVRRGCDSGGGAECRDVRDR